MAGARNVVTSAALSRGEWRVSRAAIAALVVTLIGWATADARAQTARDTASFSRMDRLDVWLAAVQRHEPGVFDQATTDIAQWGADDLRRIWLDVSSLTSLVREPSVITFHTPAERVRVLERPFSVAENPSPVRTQSAQIFYSPSEIRHLREIADSIGGQYDGRENRLLRRGATLHSDIAMLAPGEVRRGTPSSSGSRRFVLRMSDGRPLDLVSEVNHWDMGRRLLDLVRLPTGRNTIRRGPENDDTARLWYVASLVFMQATARLDAAHAARSLELFGKDRDVLFFNAVLHEIFAGPRRQTAIRSAKISRDIWVGVGSSGEELGLAERFYRRALEIDATLVEARIRYGRLLGLRGRHDEAATELQKTVTASEPVLRYYASLFLGGELEAIGRNDEAQTAYRQASSLAPGAQSPLLGLTRVTRGADRVAARQALIAAAATPVDDDDRGDPWWIYETVQARDLEKHLEALYQAVRADR